MTYLRIAAVALTILFAALLIWLYGVRTTLIWAACMAAFLGVLYLVTTPLRRRQERALRALGLDRHGRPLPETMADEPDAGPCVASDGAPQATHRDGSR
jgi:hypothetical protein